MDKIIILFLVVTQIAVSFNCFSAELDNKKTKDSKFEFQELQKRLIQTEKEIKSINLPFKKKIEKIFSKLLKSAKFERKINEHEQNFREEGRRIKIEKIKLPKSFSKLLSSGRKIIGHAIGIIGWFFEQISKIFYYLEKQLVK